MNIEKKKVERRTKLSSIAKKAIAATFGLSAAFTLNACDDSSSPTSGQVVIPADSSSSEENHEPLGGDVGTKPIEPQEPPQPPTSESSNSDAFSSSSKYLDIPQSHEAISSEVFEALSSAAESVNSSSAAPASAADSSASSLANAPSSVVQPHSSATQNLSSSSAVPSSPSSSSFKFGDTLPDYQECPPPFPSTDPCKCVPDGTTVKYQTEFGVQVIMCPQSSNSSWPSHGFSMVTTFERDDIEV